MQNFDPDLIVVNVHGHTVTQFAKGTFVEVTYDTPQWSDEVGANGDVVRIKSADKRATIKVTLMAESRSNDVLSGFVTRDELMLNETGPTLFKDILGTSLASSLESWVKEIPASTQATEATNRVWEIRCAKLVNFVGGRLDLGSAPPTP